MVPGVELLLTSRINEFPTAFVMVLPTVFSMVGVIVPVGGRIAAVMALVLLG